MKPVELFDLCMDAVDRFNRGEVFAERPFVMLTIPRASCPRGKTIRLFGGSGPTGDIATVKDRDDGQFDVVAYFPAVPIVLALGQMVGTKVNVRRV